MVVTPLKSWELPADRLGDIVVISGRDVVLGRTPEYHDLKALEGACIRTAGAMRRWCLSIFSAPLKPEYAAEAAADPRNFDILILR